MLKRRVKEFVDNLLIDPFGTLFDSAIWIAGACFGLYFLIGAVRCSFDMAQEAWYGG